MSSMTIQTADSPRACVLLRTEGGEVHELSQDEMQQLVRSRIQKARNSAVGTMSLVKMKLRSPAVSDLASKQQRDETAQAEHPDDVKDQKPLLSDDKRQGADELGRNQLNNREHAADKVTLKSPAKLMHHISEEPMLEYLRTKIQSPRAGTKSPRSNAFPLYLSERRNSSKQDTVVSASASSVTEKVTNSRADKTIDQRIISVTPKEEPAPSRTPLSGTNRMKSSNTDKPSDPPATNSPMHHDITPRSETDQRTSPDIDKASDRPPTAESPKATNISTALLANPKQSNMSSDFDEDLQNRKFNWSFEEDSSSSVLEYSPVTTMKSAYSSVTTMNSINSIDMSEMSGSNWIVASPKAVSPGRLAKMNSPKIYSPRRGTKSPRSRLEVRLFESQKSTEARNVSPRRVVSKDVLESTESSPKNINSTSSILQSDGIQGGKVSTKSPISTHHFDSNGESSTHESLFRLSMEKAKSIASVEMDEILEEAQKNAENSRLRTSTPKGGSRFLSKEEIDEYVKDSVRRAQEEALDEITNMVSESMKRAREEVDISVLVKDSFFRARERIKAEIQSAAEKDPEQSIAGDIRQKASGRLDLRRVRIEDKEPSSGPIGGMNSEWQRASKFNKPPSNEHIKSKQLPMKENSSAGSYSISPSGSTVSGSSRASAEKFLKRYFSSAQMHNDYQQTTEASEHQFPSPSSRHSVLRLLGVSPTEKGGPPTPKRGILRHGPPVTDEHNVWPASPPTPRDKGQHSPEYIEMSFPEHEGHAHPVPSEQMSDDLRRKYNEWRQQKAISSTNFQSPKGDQQAISSRTSNSPQRRFPTTQVPPGDMRTVQVNEDQSMTIRQQFTGAFANGNLVENLSPSCALYTTSPALPGVLIPKEMSILTSGLCESESEQLLVLSPADFLRLNRALFESNESTGQSKSIQIEDDSRRLGNIGSLITNPLASKGELAVPSNLKENGHSSPNHKAATSETLKKLPVAVPSDEDRHNQGKEMEASQSASTDGVSRNENSYQEHLDPNVRVPTEMKATSRVGSVDKDATFSTTGEHSTHNRKARQEQQRGRTLARMIEKDDLSPERNGLSACISACGLNLLSSLKDPIEEDSSLTTMNSSSFKSNSIKDSEGGSLKSTEMLDAKLRSLWMRTVSDKVKQVANHLFEVVSRSSTGESDSFTFDEANSGERDYDELGSFVFSQGMITDTRTFATSDGPGNEIGGQRSGECVLM